jgi:D-arabinose 1-dehydrogenase-like Zn-dependent alcohol dehydrogenase
MATMRAMETSGPGEVLRLVEREVPEPRAGWVRIKVQACGVCHGDSVVREDHWRTPIAYPRVPGHEVAGRIDALGEGVDGWQVGQSVGVGWYGGTCGTCAECLRGRAAACRNGRSTAIDFDGGYAEYMTAPVGALVRLPNGLAPTDAAPLMCAGVTTYGALRNSAARGGDLVAVQGIGGLGHLAIQFARKLGFRVAAVSRGADKASLAAELGAHEYVDAESVDPAEALRALGGAKVVLATAPNAEAIARLVGGIDFDGEIIVVAAAAEPIPVPSVALLMRRGAIRGWLAGPASGSEETARFAALTGVRPVVESFRLEAANDAYDRMMTSRVRFRGVLVPDGQ